MKNWLKNWKSEIIAIAILSFLIPILVTSSQKESEEQKNLVSSLNAELETWKNKDSLNMAKIEVIQTESTDAFLKLDTKNKEIQELQKLVQTYQKQIRDGGSATIIESNTAISGSKTTALDLPDISSIIPDSIIIKDSVQNDWIRLDYSSKFFLLETEGYNVFNYDLQVRNKYSIVIGYDKQGWFKDPKPFAEVTNHNPYTEVTMLRTYQVTKPKEKRWSIGPNISGGVNQNGLGWFIGIGVQYNLIQF